MILTILFVEEPARIAPFYRDGLGWSPTVEEANYVQFDAGLGLMRRAAAEAFAGPELTRVAPTQDTLRAEIYLHVPDPEACLQRLVGLGGRLVSDVVPRPWGDRAGYVLDPEGHLIGLAAPQP